MMAQMSVFSISFYFFKTLDRTNFDLICVSPYEPSFNFSGRVKSHTGNSLTHAFKGVLFFSVMDASQLWTIHTCPFYLHARRSTNGIRITYLLQKWGGGKFFLL